MFYTIRIKLVLKELVLNTESFAHFPQKTEKLKKK